MSYSVLIRRKIEIMNKIIHILFIGLSIASFIINPAFAAEEQSPQKAFAKVEKAQVTDWLVVGEADYEPVVKLKVNPDGIEDSGDEVVVDNDGNVGIGTLSPETKLEVSGKIAVSGTGKYSFWRDGENNIYYVNPLGIETSLNLNNCSAGVWCCNASEDICYFNSGDAELQFKLTGSHSIACMLLHEEDDLPESSKGIYFSTDGGNSCKVYTNTDESCFNLKREGGGADTIMRWSSYAIICF